MSKLIQVSKFIDKIYLLAMANTWGCKPYALFLLDKRRCPELMVILPKKCRTLLTLLSTRVGNKLLKLRNFEVYIAHSVTKKLVFELVIANCDTVKTILAQKLGLSVLENLRVNTQLKAKLGFNVQGILAEIKKERYFTKVEIENTNSVLKSWN
jgi:hypothetical protein